MDIPWAILLLVIVGFLGVVLVLQSSSWVLDRYFVSLIIIVWTIIFGMLVTINWLQGTRLTAWGLCALGTIVIIALTTVVITYSTPQI